MKHIEFKGKNLSKFEMAYIMHKNTENKKNTNYYEYLPVYLYSDSMKYDEVAKIFNEYLNKN